MDDRKIKLKLIVAHARCSNCATERILYFSSGYTYGERIVSTKSGKQCAYANLLCENIVQELKNICTELCLENGMNTTSIKLAKMIAGLYGITCDKINDEIIDTIPSTKCPNCLERTMVEDDILGEQLKEIEAFEATHNSWEKLQDKEKKEKVKEELVRQGYLE